MTAHIESRRRVFGIEPTCRALGVATSTHYARLARPPSGRAIRDAELVAEIHAARAGYRSAYGVRKTWKQLKRQGVTASRPNQLWVADLTYVRTWQGFASLAFILDVYTRMIVGWQLATHMRSTLVCDALKMAVGLRQPQPGLVVHTDRGSQYNTSLRYTDRLDEHGIAPSLGSTGDAYDNAVAEAWIATNKSELVQHRLQSYEHLEHETLAPETSRPALDEGAPAGLGTIMETNQPSLH